MKRGILSLVAALAVVASANQEFSLHTAGWDGNECMMYVRVFGLPDGVTKPDLEKWMKFEGADLGFKLNMDEDAYRRRGAAGLPVYTLSVSYISPTKASLDRDYDKWGAWLFELELTQFMSVPGAPTKEIVTIWSDTYAFPSRVGDEALMGRESIRLAMGALNRARPDGGTRQHAVPSSRSPRTR
jgi:hypothetical protein